MPAKRISTSAKPYEVVSVRKGYRGRTASFSESFDKSEDADKRADKLAKDDQIISVYVRKVDADGYPESTREVKRPKREVESAVTGSDSAE